MLHLLRPCLGEEGALGGLEVARAIGPAALLHARDGNHDLLPAAHQDGDVQDAVLARANQFLAVDQEHPVLGVVDEEQFRHAAGLGDLGHAGELAREGVIQQDVAGRALLLRHQRNQGEVAELGGRAQPDGCEGFGDRLHVVLVSSQKWRMRFTRWPTVTTAPLMPSTA